MKKILVSKRTDGGVDITDLSHIPDSGMENAIFLATHHQVFDPETKQALKDASGNFVYSQRENYVSWRLVDKTDLPDPRFREFWTDDFDTETVDINQTKLLAKKKLDKKQAINSQRDANIAKDTLCNINGVSYFFQRNIASNLAWLNTIEGSDEIIVTNWVTADNQIIDLTKSHLISICSHIRDRDTQEVVQARKKKDALAALTTIEEVDAFDITQVFEV